MGSWRHLVGGSALWVGLSAVFDGAHLIIVPGLVAATVDPNMKASALGLVSFAALALAALAQPYFGALSDRSRARMGRLAFAAPGVLGALVGIAALTFATEFWVVVAAVLLTYLSASAAQAAQQGLLPELFGASQRGLASGAKQFADLVGAAAAFALLAALIRQGSATALTAVAIILTVSYVVARGLVREPAVDASEDERVADRSQAARAQLDVRFGRLIATRFVFLLATYAIGRFLVFLIESRLALSAVAAAAATAQLVAVLTLATALSAVGWGLVADRIGRAKVSAAGSVLSALGAGGLLAAGDLVALNAAGVLLALGSGAFASANWAATADAAPAGGAGRALGIASVATWAAAACAGLLGPLVDIGNSVAAGGGYVALLSVSLVLFLLCVPLALIREREVHVDALTPLTR